ncbi:MAG: lysophospholipid acyltransferase family protein [Ignavibacteriales bacterium]|nr:lysophospholipid acyltransferase family protein [Ignavibacteriales bacterium]
MFLTIAKLIFLFPVSLLLSLLAFGSIPFDRKGDFFRWCPWTWSKCILWTFGIKVHLKGLENIDLHQPYIFVSNHASMADIPTVLVALNGKANIVFKKELTWVPIWGWALRYGPFIMIDRSNPRDAMASIERAVKTIRSGQSVILFPEGTRTRDGKLQPFKRGAFTLAAKSGVSVVPMTINNTFGIMPKGSFIVKQADISVVLEKPILTDGLQSKTDELELMDQVHKAIEKHYVDQS